MGETYSTYDAKARFSEVLRKVRAGQRIRITHHGKPVAEIGPIPAVQEDIEARLADLEGTGQLQGHVHHVGDWEILCRVAGGLNRFLEERE